jgi:hypothetical protein
MKLKSGGGWSTSTKNMLELIQSGLPLIIEVRASKSTNRYTSEELKGEKVLLNNREVTL